MHICIAAGAASNFELKRNNIILQPTPRHTYTMHSDALLLSLLTCCICVVAAQASVMTESEENRYEKEIKCYGLPYGVTGFISHLLTYYTAIMLACGRTPLLPWREVDQGPQNIFLGIAKLILTTVASIPSIVTCVHTWFVPSKFKPAHYSVRNVTDTSLPQGVRRAGSYEAVSIPDLRSRQHFPRQTDISTLHTWCDRRPRRIVFYRSIDNVRASYEACHGSLLGLGRHDFRHHHPRRLHMGARAIYPSGSLSVCDGLWCVVL